MDISEYRNRNRRPITLPSGLKGFVRAPSVMDLATYPALIAAQMGGSRGGVAEGESTRQWVHCVLRRCFVPESGVMCDKEPNECLPGEISVHELTPEDAREIMAAVSGLGEEAVPSEEEASPAGAPFPARDETRPAETPEPASPPGEDLRPAAPPSG